MSPIASRLAAGLAISCTLHACERAGSSDAVSVRDSAGVRIVENLAPVWSADTPAWRVADTPSVVIGEEEGRGPYLLSRVSDALSLGDGTIVVADGASLELRWFDPDGRHVRSVGRRGGGPGEFTLFSRLLRTSADSIAMLDIRASRVTLVGPDGGLGAIVPLQAAMPGLPSPVYRYADGRLLITSGVPGERRAGEVFQDSLRFAVFDAEGREATVLFDVPGARRLVTEVGGVRTFPFLPFEGLSSFAADETRVFEGSGRDRRVDVRSVAGVVTGSIRWGGPARRVPAEYVARYREDALAVAARNPNTRPMIERYFADVQWPDSLPAYRRLVVDDARNLWVEAFRPNWEREPTWLIFDPGGRWLGELGTPPGFRPTHIAVDRIVGVHTDELGVERVQVYALARD